MNLSLLLPSIAAASFQAAAPDAGAEAEYFETNIRPLLVEHCQDCHGEKKQKGGLRLDTRAGWTAGGDSGAAIAPGKPEASLLMKAVHYGDKDLQMPPKDKGGKLTDGQIAALEEWIRRGAYDPREAAARIGGMTAEEAKAWWAFQPVRNPKPFGGAPGVDAWLDAKLSEAGIPAAPATDARTLLRRMSFDLTGLPPSTEELAKFETAFAGNASAAVSAAVDRLLASPQYGEQWARHWLDVVRYADSLDERSYDKDGDILDSWRYRDWVVDAFNRDLPYDQFIVDQIAGDILADREWNPTKVVATSVYAIGSWGNGDADKEKVHTDIVDDQIDVTGRAFLGLTLACARCHDHKFDPLTSRDYYGMAGFFFSSRILEKFAGKGDGERLARWPLISPSDKSKREEAQRRIAEIDGELSGGLQPLAEHKRDILGKPGLHAWAPKGADNPSVVINTTDAEQKFITIRLPARAIAVHPGPKIAATIAWKSPLNGKVRVAARVRDADPNCGNGIEWEMKQAAKRIGGGTMDNGGAAELPETEIDVREGELVRLVIRPRGEYTCDSTQTDFTITGANGKHWDVRAALVNGGGQGHDGVWWLCSGEGAEIGSASTKAESLQAEKKALQSAMAETGFTQGLQEGGIPSTIWQGFHNARIHGRGRYDRLGDEVPRSFPALLATEPPKIESGSGRLELARWIASPQNPLTARVMVNRIWQHHFGEGLVRTENNFGKLGTPPTHPELLDWLASEFMRSGWSVKHVQRLILTSAAYRRASALPPDIRKVAAMRDPDNRLLSYFPRQRLSAEQLRDAMLAASGELNLERGGKSTRNVESPRRTLYITSIRSNRSDFKALFDGADSNGVVEQRTESTVAPQALWLMNHPFVAGRAKALSQKVVAIPGGREAQLRWLFERLFAHPATVRDMDLAARAVSDATSAAQWEPYCHMLLCSNRFVYLD